MRIVIDLQGAQTVYFLRDISRTALELSQAIVRNQGDHEVHIALNGSFQDTIEPIRAAFSGLIEQKIFIYGLLRDRFVNVTHGIRSEEKSRSSSGRHIWLP